MDLRHFTPPAEVDYSNYNDLQCPRGSASTDGSYNNHGCSPETAITTPPRSPTRIRDLGSRLLPKPCHQDQLQENSAHTPCRTASLPNNVFSMQFASDVRQQDNQNRSISPYPYPKELSSTLASSPVQLSISRPSKANMTSLSSSHISNVRCHSRDSSSSSIDATMLSRYGYPTYRQSPTPQPMANPASYGHSRTPSALNHLAPIALHSAQMQSYPSNRRTTSPPARTSRLSVEADVPFPSDLPSPTSTVLDYLTAPNPAPSLVTRICGNNKLQTTHFWFDARNIRPWQDFNLGTISSIPGLFDLLNIDVSVKSLPRPGAVNLEPETTAQLADLCAMHHAVKVNAALKLAQGDKHIAMRTLRSPPTARPQPHFIASYHTDSDQTIHGTSRGRVIGIVKSYNEWTSDLRKGNPNAQIRYLEPLAQLQRFMREHGTRYGFLMTEIELVCVRAGGPRTTKDGVPLFGYLEISAAIPISTSGRNYNNNNNNEKEEKEKRTQQTKYPQNDGRPGIVVLTYARERASLPRTILLENGRRRSGCFDEKTSFTAGCVDARDQEYG